MSDQQSFPSFVWTIEIYRTNLTNAKGARAYKDDKQQYIVSLNIKP
jgi:hypothetical protein